MSETKTVAELLVSFGMETREAEQASRTIKKVLTDIEKQAQKAGDKVDQISDSFRGLDEVAARAGRLSDTIAKGLAVAAGAVAGLGTAVIGTGAQFELLTARLTTTEKSAEGAERALSFIKDFAKETPFQVAEITESFLKLKGVGIDPTREALTDLGNFAAQRPDLGLTTFIEAVSDATTGEFERLKEFRVKAKSEGDQVTLTFNNQSRTVQKNSQDIVRALREISQENFGGAMSIQMGTLTGLISNLKDSFTEFLLSVAEKGPLDEFKKLVEELKALTGERGGLADVLARILVKAIRTVRRALQGDFVRTLERVAAILEFVIDNFEELVALFVAGKTVQAFASVVSGLQTIGVAATGALGPIGAIAAALVALLPVAIRVKGELDKVFSFSGAALQRGLEASFARQQELVVTSATGRIEQEISQDKAQLQTVKPGSFAAKELQANIKRNEAQLSKLKTEQEAARKRAEAAQKRQEDSEKARRFGTLLRTSFETGLSPAEIQQQEKEDLEFDRKLAEANKLLGISEGVALTPNQRRLQEEALAALAEGKSAKQAVSAADKALTQRRGRKGKRPVSATTVSQFFGAAARGQLGEIAARTPSVKEIEPTVAVDVTNNNFKLELNQNIKGMGDPAETANQVVEIAKRTFDANVQRAGQSLKVNKKR